MSDQDAYLEEPIIFIGPGTFRLHHNFRIYHGARAASLAKQLPGNVSLVQTGVITCGYYSTTHSGV